MTTFNSSDIKVAIQSYLNTEFETALKKEVSEMKNPTDKGVEKKHAKLKPEFEYSQWLEGVIASIQFMQTQTMSFATHTSKGIHSSVRSDNIIFLNQKDSNPSNIVGTHSIDKNIDANSNNTGSHAGHLKAIINFLNLDIAQQKFYWWIKENNNIFKLFFENNASQEDFVYLRNLLNQKIVDPESDERNKQLLFPVENLHYYCIVPLYPSSLSNHLFHKINYIKYSDESKKARNSRKENKNHSSYKEVPNLAITKLGGNNAQNVSRFNNQQSGINYLLPSLPPPDLTKNKSFKSNEYLPSKFTTSIFNGNAISYRCKQDIKKIFEVVQERRNTIDIRKKRKHALDDVLQRIFSIAEYIKNTLPAGWSKEYQLDFHQKLWLDPLRATLEDEEDFSFKREQEEWHTKVIEDFASWMNILLQEEFPKYKADFSDDEYKAWEVEFMKMKERYERAGKGVFL